MNEWVPAIITTAGALFVAFMTYRSTRKGDKEAHDLTERRDTITDREALLDIYREELDRRDAAHKKDLDRRDAEHARELAKRDARLNEMERRLNRAEETGRQVEDHNNQLIKFIYNLISILRELGEMERITQTDVPDGIHL